MTYCFTEGCKCTTKTGFNAPKLGASFRELRICNCCAFELYPGGITINGRYTNFNLGSVNCRKRLKQEKEDLQNKKRKVKAKQ